MVTLNLNDLAHILDQIRIAEEHNRLIEGGMDAREALASLIASPLVPDGLRTVTGELNNYQIGYTQSGASDNLMDRLLDPVWIAAQANPRSGAPTSYAQASGSVYDARPRTISNLVADQTLGNIAAISAALAIAGVTGSENIALSQQIHAAYRAAQDGLGDLAGLPPRAELEAALATQQAELAAANAAVVTASTALGDATAAVTAAEAALAAAEAALAALSQDVVAAEADLAAATAALSLAQQADADAAAAAASAAAALAVAEGDLAAAEATLADAQLALTEAQDAADLTEAARLQAQADFDAAFAAERAANVALLIELADGDSSDNQAALDAYNAAFAALTAAQATLDAANAADLAADAALADADAAFAAAQTARDAAAALVAPAQAASDSAAATAATAAADLAAAESDLADAQAALDAANAAVAGDLGAATQAVTDAEAALAEAEGLRDIAQTTLDTAEAAVQAEIADVTAAQEALAPYDQAALADAEVQALLTANGIEMDGVNVALGNVSADLGDTAPYNSFFTIFGQFFDHGLDLTQKGGNGTVYIPLQPDDPLYEPGSPTNFMVLTRATNQPGPDGVLGTADDVRENANETTPWIDLNQVYTSNPSHQVFLREYVLHEGRPIATGRMLESATGGPPTWADIKAQARSMLGIELSDLNVHSVPAVLTDLYGRFVPDAATGMPQFVLAGGGAVSGSIAAPVDALTLASAGRAFLNDIAHDATPGAVDLDPTDGVTTLVFKTADTDTDTANPQPTNMFGVASTYDNELLDRHFIVGDGRGNENIALTAVHTIFHGEHNRQIEAVQDMLLASGDLAMLNEYLLVPVTAMPTSGADLVWNGERLFQTGRFTTEMVYQHLVFEEFVRAIAPQIDPFVFSNSVEIPVGISQEFAQVVYRFGHSMLNETVDMLGMLDATGALGETGVTGLTTVELFDAFLNPVMFDAQGGDAHAAAGAILRGMTRQHGNEIDEFLTDALRNNLVGLPLDLAALNMARARDVGIPSLNEARRQFFEQTQNTYLRPYESWSDFAAAIKNPLSVVNFIAAYGTHDSITSATTIEAKRDAAMLLVLGGADAPADRLAFLNATGTWAGGSLGGLNSVDFWIGGLAEAKMSFGGMLGSTFTFVFEAQMEMLQNGDRFYYLSRTQGMNLLSQLESDSFADLIQRNTDGEHLGLSINGAAFQTADWVLEIDQSRQWNPDIGSADPTREADVLTSMLGTTSLVERGANYIRYLGGEHVVLGGTSGDDTIIGGDGDDGLWGYGGHDVIEGGFGVDHIHGGAGNDIITDRGTDIGDADVIKGEDGDDVINGGMGLDLIFGGAGRDVISGGDEAKDIFGGQGDDFIRAPTGGGGIVFGNEGNDWMEGQGNMNTLTGDNSELFFNSRIIGHDVMFAGENDTDFDAESGDDIMFQGIGINRNNGMAGFDWVAYKGNAYDVDADMNLGIFQNQQANILRDRFDLVEGLSGWTGDDRLTGREVVTGAYDAQGNAAQVSPTSPIQSYSNALLEQNIDLIDGLRDLVSHLGTFDIVQPNTGERLTARMDTSTGAAILLGGAGSDTIRGMSGDDIIDGDRWLNARIEVRVPGQPVGTADGLTHQIVDVATGAVMFGGMTLERALFARVISPSELEVVREILDGGQAGDVDTARYWDLRENYTITSNADGSITVTHNTASLELIDPVTGVDRALDPLTGRRLELEGSDRLRNIEVLSFADQDILLVNQPATGAPVISDTTPTEGQALSVDLSAIADPNGLGAGGLSVQWQRSPDGGATWVNIGGATGTSFTPAQAQVGQALRVQVQFTDGLGTLETVVSAPTTVVGDVLNGTGGGNTLTGTAGEDIINGQGGADTINALAGNDAITGGTGNDLINAGDGDDTITWGVTDPITFFGFTIVAAQPDGRDVINGGDNGAGGDTFIINGNNQAETYRIYARADFLAVNPGAPLAAATEIVVTRNGTSNASVIAELAGIEEIIVNTGPGADTVTPIGSFAGTSLRINTIRVNGSEGDDTVDISALDSAHRIVFRTGGGNDMVVGTLRPQDVIEVPAGNDPAAYATTDNGNGTVTMSNGSHSVTFTGSASAVPTLVESSTVEDHGVGSTDGGNETPAPTLTANDAAGLLDLVRGISPDGNDDGANALGVRTLTGVGNNPANPTQGAHGEAFIRVTENRSGAYDAATGNNAINPIFDGLDTRTISDILGAQAPGTAPSANANAFFTAFAQYFDHGLSFIPKGGNGTIQIGAPGAGARAENPADLTRASVMGFDADGAAQHRNLTSPFVDQNQVYGSTNLIGQLLRESDGAGGLGARVLMGAEDPSAAGHDLLPTLRDVLMHHIEAGTVFRAAHLAGGAQTLVEFYPDLLDADGAINAAVLPGLVSNFMGEGQPLLLDTNPFINLLDHVVAGDGRVNENITLTSMHTIFARNHNFHVEQLAASYQASGTVLTLEELFQAAKIVNEAEYQRVVFTEFAETLLGGVGIRGAGDHGFTEWNPETDAAISQEFASAVYRFGHTMVAQTVSVTNPDGTVSQVSLFDAFLNPTNAEGAFTQSLATLAQYGYVPQPGYAQLGAGAVLSGIAGQAAEQVDTMVVDGIRNDLVRVSADLFAFNVARGRDVGIGTLNQVKASLLASTNPYIREALSFVDPVLLQPYSSWEDFGARNGLSAAMLDQFRAAYPDLVLADQAAADAFAALNPDIGLIANADGSFTVQGIDRVDLWVGGLAEAKVNGGLVGSTFWVVIHEQLDRLQEGDRFYYVDRLENFDLYANFVEGQSFADIVMRNTGLVGLDERIFEVSDEDGVAGVDQGDDDTDADDDGIGAGGDDGAATDNDEDGATDDGDAGAGTDDADTGGDDTGTDTDTGTDSGTDTGSDEEDDEEAGNGPGNGAGTGGGAGVPQTPPVVEGAVLMPGTGSGMVSGGAGADVLVGGAEADALMGKAGDDILMGHGGDDVLTGGAGDDLLSGGQGTDVLMGEDGDDRFTFAADDGADMIFGGAGIDTIDLSAILGGAAIDLGAATAIGTVRISGVTDSLVGIENVIGSQGADVIKASLSVNVLTGGDGEDVFVFTSAGAADGDVITDFQPGDRIDLAGIDARVGLNGNQSFTLAEQGAAGPGSLVIREVATADGVDTIIEGHTNDDDEADFSLTLRGAHNLDASSFGL
ncbi:MAG: peroxidase family protein [Paracoccaceae bacterium]